MRAIFPLVGILAVCVIAGCGGGEKADGDKASATTDGGDSKATDDSKKDGQPAANTGSSEGKDDTNISTGRTGAITLAPANTKITFSGVKDDGKFEGGFQGVTGAIQLGDSGPKTVDLTIETNSLYSDDKKLTDHLLSPDFFEVTSFPKASIISTKVDSADGDATHTLTADFTMRGVTKSMAIPLHVVQSGNELKLTAGFSISGKEFGFDGGPDKIQGPIKIHIAIDTGEK